jgi:hypothetical protein
MNYTGITTKSNIMKTQQTLSQARFLLLFGLSIVSSLVFYGCCKTYPLPVIKYDHRDIDGRIYIPVVNWNVYPDRLFVEAPGLPPCGNNTKSSRTWVDIYNADNNARLYGFCAFKKSEDLNGLWFTPSTRSGKVYIIINDRKCHKTYKSNTVEWGECLDSLPVPEISFDHKDNEGRVYIPVTNWKAYSDDLFRQAPELPPCGLNTNSSRTWIEIFNADDNVRVYGFCALSKKSDLQGIWYLPKNKTGKAYITINDRACNRQVKSNTISW